MCKECIDPLLQQERTPILRVCNFAPLHRSHPTLYISSNVSSSSSMVVTVSSTSLRTIFKCWSYAYEEKKRPTSYILTSTTPILRSPFCAHATHVQLAPQFPAVPQLHEYPLIQAEAHQVQRLLHRHRLHVRTVRHFWFPCRARSLCCACALNRTSTWSPIFCCGGSRPDKMRAKGNVSPRRGDSSRPTLRGKVLTILLIHLHLPLLAEGVQSRG